MLFINLLSLDYYYRLIDLFIMTQLKQFSNTIRVQIMKSKEKKIDCTKQIVDFYISVDNCAPFQQYFYYYSPEPLAFGFQNNSSLLIPPLGRVFFSFVYNHTLQIFLNFAQPFTPQTFQPGLVSSIPAYIMRLGIFSSLILSTWSKFMILRNFIICILHR